MGLVNAGAWKETKGRAGREPLNILKALRQQSNYCYMQHRICKRKQNNCQSQPNFDSYLMSGCTTCFGFTWLLPGTHIYKTIEKKCTTAHN